VSNKKTTKPEKEAKKEDKDKEKNEVIKSTFYEYYYHDDEGLYDKLEKIVNSEQLYDNLLLNKGIERRNSI
jgi:hypothetical protein